MTARCEPGQGREAEAVSSLCSAVDTGDAIADGRQATDTWWVSVCNVGSIQRALPYNPAFDGLRAVAVLAVMFDHFQVPGFSGGGFGVDIFFVLSGYLITSLLVAGFDQGQPLGVFYWRRFTRLAPALMFVCAALLLIAPVLGLSTQIGWDSLASLLYVSNWTRAFPTGSPMFLGNTWSLAVEEQFYLVWPLLLLVMLRVRGRRFAAIGSAALLVAAILWQQWLIIDGASVARVYNGFDTRCYGLLIGCVVALGRNTIERFPRLVRLAAIAGAALILVVFHTFAWIAPISLAVSFAAGAVIADLSTATSGPLRRLLGVKPLQVIGRISYALYLWHYPVMLLLYWHFLLSRAVGAPIGIAAAFFFATVSYYAVERPGMRLRTWLSEYYVTMAGRTTAALSVGGMAVGIGVFWNADIVNLVHPKPIEIVGYGPQSIRRGETFNIQPDGRSVLWIHTSRSVPDNARIEVGTDMVESVVQGVTILGFIPSDIRNRVGAVTVTIIDPEGGTLAGPAIFQVIP